MVKKKTTAKNVKFVVFDLKKKRIINAEECPSNQFAQCLHESFHDLPLEEITEDNLISVFFAVEQEDLEMLANLQKTTEMAFVNNIYVSFVTNDKVQKNKFNLFASLVYSTKCYPKSKIMVFSDEDDSYKDLDTFTKAVEDYVEYIGKEEVKRKKDKNFEFNNDFALGIDKSGKDENYEEDVEPLNYDFTDIRVSFYPTTEIAFEVKKEYINDYIKENLIGSFVDVVYDAKDFKSGQKLQIGWNNHKMLMVEPESNDISLFYTPIEGYLDGYYKMSKEQQKYFFNN